jgi:hypothetical protein
MDGEVLDGGFDGWSPVGVSAERVVSRAGVEPSSNGDFLVGMGDQAGRAVPAGPLEAVEEGDVVDVVAAGRWPLDAFYASVAVLVGGQLLGDSAPRG